MYSFKYNQQDATLYNILIAVNAVHVSDGFSAHHQELKIQNLLAATASGNSKQAGHIPDVVCTVFNFELLMMGGETARNM
jgi:3,4-dihydroxy-2-butanone 4-phosphate synthase